VTHEEFVASWPLRSGSRRCPLTGHSDGHHARRPDYLLFVEHFADQAAHDAHTGSAAYQDLIAGKFAGRIVEFTELNHELGRVL
jgi:hypothetical protein